MTDTSREAVERLLDGVTPGPWLVGEDQCVDDTWSIVTTSGGAVLANVNDRPARTANARFIAWCRDGVPALLARAEAAEARLHEFQAAQGYRYIGRDMKPVLARDLEDRAEAAEAERDALKSAQIDAIRAALEEVVAICTDLAIGYEGHECAPTALMDAVSHTRALDPAAIAAKLKGDGDAN